MRTKTKYLALAVAETHECETLQYHYLLWGEADNICRINKPKTTKIFTTLCSECNVTLFKGKIHCSFMATLFWQANTC